MRYSYRIEPFELEFIKPAKTSRNTFTKRIIYLIHLSDLKTGRTGIGEAAPLEKLSIDDIADYLQILKNKLDLFCSETRVEELELEQFPSIAFGLETALQDLKYSEPQFLFDTPFSRGKSKIPVNGLVWMAELDDMELEAHQKIEAGFNCIKFKVGAHDFDAECRLIERIRRQYSAFKLEIRLDANGAFVPDLAAEQLKELQRFEIHSIEQPIKPNHWHHMARLCSENIIPVALDEELIGRSIKEQSLILNEISPQYIILKPNLIGGMKASDLWISEAQKRKIAWWATSALEGNIGLNAIAQWVSSYEPDLHQGLGTGSLYKSNFPLNLELKNGMMQRIPNGKSPLK